MLRLQSAKDSLIRAHREIVLGVSMLPGHPFTSEVGVRFGRSVDDPVSAVETLFWPASGEMLDKP